MKVAKKMKMASATIAARSTVVAVGSQRFRIVSIVLGRVESMQSGGVG